MKKARSAKRVRVPKTEPCPVSRKVVLATAGSKSGTPIYSIHLPLSEGLYHCVSRIVLGLRMAGSHANLNTFAWV